MKFALAQLTRYLVKNFEKVRDSLRRSSVEDAIHRVVESPQRWRVIDEDIRRCLTHVFPYAVL
jgi:toxin ParE1/3/4